MVAMLALVLAQATMSVPAPGRAVAIPATRWSCDFSGADGSRFRLAGQIAEMPAGSDPNRSIRTEVETNGPANLGGQMGATASHGSDYFREYQLEARRGIELYHVNIKLRRVGAGVGEVTRYTENNNHEPYSYLAAGLCTADFAPGAAPEGARP